MKVENEILIPEMGKLLSEGKEVRFTPTGVSMRPFIEGGKDIVVLRQQSTVRVGDIVLAAAPEPHYVLHRVIKINGDNLALQGDGNLVGIEQCRKEDIYGTVVKILNAKGRAKCLTRGRLWYYLRPCRKILLKIYRHL